MVLCIILWEFYIGHLDKGQKRGFGINYVYEQEENKLYKYSGNWINDNKCESIKKDSMEIEEVNIKEEDMEKQFIQKWLIEKRKYIDKKNKKKNK